MGKDTFFVHLEPVDGKWWMVWSTLPWFAPSKSRSGLGIVRLIKSHIRWPGNKGHMLAFFSCCTVILVVRTQVNLEDVLQRFSPSPSASLAGGRSACHTAGFENGALLLLQMLDQQLAKPTLSSRHRDFLSPPVPDAFAAGTLALGSIYRIHTELPTHPFSSLCAPNPQTRLGIAWAVSSVLRRKKQKSRSPQKRTTWSDRIAYIRAVTDALGRDALKEHMTDSHTRVESCLVERED